MTSAGKKTAQARRSPRNRDERREETGSEASLFRGVGTIAWTDREAIALRGFDMAAIRPGALFKPEHASHADVRLVWAAAFALSLVLHFAALIAAASWSNAERDVAAPEAISVEIVADVPPDPATPPPPSSPPSQSEARVDSPASPAEQETPPLPAVEQPPAQESPSPAPQATPPQQQTSLAEQETPPLPAVQAPPAVPSSPTTESIEAPSVQPSVPPQQALPKTAVEETPPLPPPQAAPIAPKVKPPETQSAPISRPAAKPVPPRVVAPRPIAKPLRGQAEPEKRASARAAQPAEERSSGSREAVSSAEIAAYQSSVLNRIAAAKRYPEPARERQLHGVAVVRFTISASGQVGGAAVTQSAGDPILDSEAVATVRRASPFPPPPPGAPRAFSASLNYRIR
jgi:periplasmic protein TonB